MPPPFIDRMRPRFSPEAVPEMPPPLPPTDPMQEARDWCDRLRAYAEQVLRVAQQTADANRNLIAENAALARQNEHLMEQNDALIRDNRTVHAYAQNLRSRLTAIREALQSAENESLEYATSSVRLRPASTVQEDAAGEEVREILERARQPAPPPTPRAPPIPERPLPTQHAPGGRLPVNQY